MRILDLFRRHGQKAAARLHQAAQTKRRTSRRMLFESLEERRVMAAYVWAGPGGLDEAIPGPNVNNNVWRQSDDGNYSDRLTVTFKVTGGTATNGVDYQLDEQTVVMDPGVINVEVPILVKDDADPEPIETIIVSVISAVSYTGKTYELMSHEGQITDNDPWPTDPAPKNAGCPDCSTMNAPSAMNAANSGAATGAGVTNSGSGSDTTKHPIRFHDGAVYLASVDLSSHAGGIPWGVTRHWTNAPGYSRDNSFGLGMVVAEQPTLIEVNAGDQVALIADGHTAYYFDRSGSVVTVHSLA